MPRAEKTSSTILQALVLLILLCSWVRQSFFREFIGYDTLHPFVLFTALSLVLLFFLKKNPSLSETRGEILPWIFLFLYAAITCGSTFFNIPFVEPVEIFNTLSLALCILILGFCLPHLLSMAAYENIFKITLVFLAILSFYHLLVNFTGTQSLFGHEVYALDQAGGRLNSYGLYSHRNYGAHMVQWLPAILGFLWFKYRQASPLIFICAAIIGVHLLTSLSRTAYLVFFISCLPLVFFIWREKKHHFPAYFLGSGIIFLIFFLILPGFAGRVHQGFDLNARNDIWGLYLYYWRSFDIFYFGSGLNWHIIYRRPHSVFLANLTFFGMVGLTIYLALLLTLARTIYFNFRNYFSNTCTQFLIFLLIGLLAGAFFDNYLNSHDFLPYCIFWLIAGLLAFKKPKEILKNAS